MNNPNHRGCDAVIWPTMIALSCVVRLLQTVCGGGHKEWKLALRGMYWVAFVQCVSPHHLQLTSTKKSRRTRKAPG